MSLSLLSNLVAKSIRIHHPRFDSEEIPPELPHDSWPHHSAPSIPWFSTHWWITHLEGKSDKHDSSESHEVVSRFWSVLAVVYVIFSAFLSIRNIQTWEGQWSIAWSIWLRKIGITSRQNPPDKQSGQNQPYHPHRKYEEGSVTVIFVWTMSVYSPEVNVDVAPEKVSKKQYLIRSCFKRYVMFQGCKANLCLEVGTPSAFSRDKSSKRSQVIGCNKHQDLHSDRSWLQKIVAWWLMLTVS